ncbi:MAG: DUF3422 family protein [Granulosicoccaceae bacterium]
MKAHPLREQLIQEVHARPFYNLQAPLALCHIAVSCTGDDREAIAAHMLHLAPQLGLDAQPANTGFFFCRNNEWALRYEPHTDFFTVTLYHLQQLKPPSFPLQWLEKLPGQLLCGNELTLRGQQTEHPADREYLVQSLAEGKARIRTDFQPMGSSRFNRFIVQSLGIQDAQTGRLLNLLCEIETYRHAALLSLPLARELMPRITTHDQELARIVERTEAGEDAGQLLQDLMTLASSVESLSAQSANRFSASEAYFGLVDRRIGELREQHEPGYLNIGEFMDRHLAPARATCLACGSRIDQLSRRIARTTELIRSQVSLNLESQNRDLLTAINKRTNRQLKLQAKVEGLTVIVVTYYAFDLLERSLRNLLPSGDWQILSLKILSALVPLIALSLYFYIRKLLRQLDED